MKAYSFFRKYIVVLLAVFSFVSCSDDGELGVLDSSMMLNQEFLASNYSFIWNGVTFSSKTDVKAKFEPIVGDSTKMKMTIFGILPSSDDIIQLVVDVIPHTDEIQYQGKVENSDYDMMVNGIYFPSKSNVGYYFKLKIVYEIVNKSFVENSYRFNFKKGCTAIPSVQGGNVVIDGDTYSKAHVAENVLNGMTDLYAKTDSCVQFCFAKDGSLSLDLLNNTKGKDVATNWMTLKYWFASNRKTLFLEFTKAQAEAFAAKFLDDKADDIERLFTKYEDTDKYVLEVRYYTMDGKLSLELVSPYLERAMSVFAAGKASELDANLQKQANAFASELQESASHWQIQFVSE